MHIDIFAKISFLSALFIFIMRGSVVAELFERNSPVEIDIDGDGRLDTVQPRTFSQNPKKGLKEEWIEFTFTLTGGRKVNPIRYKYGNEDGRYYSYSLYSQGDMNHDGI